MKQAIEDFLLSLSCEASEQQIDQLERYARLLWEANARVNLTRHVEVESFLSRDVRDAVALCGHLRPNESVLDVGSGGGIPGILVAILRPDVAVSLAESIGKKADALTHFVTTLDLPATVHNARGENVLGDNTYDVLTVRAVGSISKLCSLFKKRWSRFTRLLLLKGPNWAQEVKDAAKQIRQAGLSVECLEQYPMHGSDSMAVIVEVKRDTHSAQA